MNMSEIQTLSYSESVAISYIRGIACILIVACHIFQSSNHLDMAFLLNIGVQLFFCISGLLYGKKVVTSWPRFVKGRFLSLYMPFILFALPVLLYVSISYGGIDAINYIAYLTMGQVIFGEIVQLAHLWFISAIVICYVFVPILQMLRKWHEQVLLLIFLVSILE